MTVDILARLDEMLDAVRATLAASDLSDKALVTVSEDGRDVLNAMSLRAGAIIIYAYPAQEFPAPKVTKLTWTIGVVAHGEKVRDAATRVQALIDICAEAGIVRWADKATPTDFELADQATVPGYAIAHIEEHID